VRNNLEIFNEAVILQMASFMLLYTNPALLSDQRDYLGYANVSLSLLLILVNVVYALIVWVIETSRSARLYYY